MSNEKIMTNDCMMQFIKSLGRSELYEELTMMKTVARPPEMTKESYYLKGICVTLMELGYDAKWVVVTFRPAFEEYYMHGDEAISK